MTVRPPRGLRTPRDLWEAIVDVEPFLVQVIEGRVVAHRGSPPDHHLRTSALSDELFPLRRARGWRGQAGGVVCMAGTHEPVMPDYTLAPADCARWRGAELLSSGVIMLAEVTCDLTAHDDRVVKPRVYARGGVPIYLLIDPADDPPSVTVFSGSGGAYQSVTRVLMGEPITLPPPIEHEIDTSIFRM